MISHPIPRPVLYRPGPAGPDQAVSLFLYASIYLVYCFASIVRSGLIHCPFRLFTGRANFKNRPVDRSHLKFFIYLFINNRQAGRPASQPVNTTSSCLAWLVESSRVKQTTDRTALLRPVDPPTEERTSGLAGLTWNRPFVRPSVHVAN